MSRRKNLLIIAVLFAAVFHLPLFRQATADESGSSVPTMYRGLLDGYYVELVVDWLPDKAVEGDIWTAAHKVTPEELGFVFAKVRGDNPVHGHLELQILEEEDEGTEKNRAEFSKKLGEASLTKKLTRDYIEWSGEYRSATGEKVPMMLYRERRKPDAGSHVSIETGKQDEALKRSSHGADYCGEGSCDPVGIEVCVLQSRTEEAKDYFQWLHFPVEVLCGAASQQECKCDGERWLLEVDGFSEPYWVQELVNLPFITSARRSSSVTGLDPGIIEMPIASYFSGAVPNHAEAMKKLNEFLNDYFSSEGAEHPVEIKVNDRSKFNYVVDLSGPGHLLSLHKPGVWERHTLRVIMSQPYPDRHPDKFAVYLGLPSAQYAEWPEDTQLPPDTFSDIEDSQRTIFMEKMISALAHRHRAAMWTP
jgi:hypothetical protein